MAFIAYEPKKKYQNDQLVSIEQLLYFDTDIPFNNPNSTALQYRVRQFKIEATQGTSGSYHVALYWHTLKGNRTLPGVNAIIVDDPQEGIRHHIDYLVEKERLANNA